MPKQSPPTLQLRKLDISDEVPGFVYQWKVCKKTGLFGKCREYEIQQELYDLRDEVIRKQLIDMDFIGVVREKLPMTPTQSSK